MCDQERHTTASTLLKTTGCEARNQDEEVGSDKRLPDLLRENAWLETIAALGLTQKEADVVVALLRGDGEKEVALRLAVSRRTVHARLERLHSRLGVHSRTELLVTVLTSLLSAGVNRDEGKA